MEQEIIVINHDKLLSNIDVSELPKIFSSQVQKFCELDKKVKTAVAQANSALESADYARSKPAGWLQKREAIEALQLFGSDVAAALASGAIAQETMFEFMTEIVKMERFSIGLGLSNTVDRQCIIRELELRLKGATEEELSDLAKQELHNVISQLKAQQDILNKQEQLDKKIKIIHDENVRLCDQLDIQIELNKHYSGELQILATEDKRLAEEIKANAEVNKRHDDELKAQGETEKRNNELLVSLVRKIDEHDNDNTVINKKLIISYIFGGTGVLVGCLALLLVLLI